MSEDRCAEVRYVDIVKRSDNVDRLAVKMTTTQWRLALWALYLGDCRYIPDLAKRTHGVSMGFCTPEGDRLQPSEDGATHYGWTLDPLVS